MTPKACSVNPAQERLQFLAQVAVRMMGATAIMPVTESEEPEKVAILAQSMQVHLNQPVLHTCHPLSSYRVTGACCSSLPWRENPQD